MSDAYRTIAAPSEAVFREKMSRFLSFAFPVFSAEEARRRIAAVQNEYHDARHVCWAYMLGADCKEFQSNDNGEPSGTAGKPILGQIRSFELSNVVICVVRYFGGIKLGTSGLIAAYREAARLALDAAEIVERHETADITFSFPYLAMNDVMRLVKQSSAEIVSQSFDNSCEMTLRLPREAAETLKARLEDLDGVTF